VGEASLVPFRQNRLSNLRQDAFSLFADAPDPNLLVRLNLIHLTIMHRLARYKKNPIVFGVVGVCRECNGRAGGETRWRRAAQVEMGERLA
jgi:hypothetical protein